MEITVAVLVGLVFGLLVEFAQARLGWWVGVVGGVIASATALYAYEARDVGGIVVFVFGSAYLLTEIARSWFTRGERHHRRDLVSH